MLNVSTVIIVMCEHYILNVSCIKHFMFYYFSGYGFKNIMLDNILREKDNMFQENRSNILIFYRYLFRR